MNGYFLFNEVAYASHCLRGTLLQSTYSDIFAEESAKELCGEAHRGQEPARHGSHHSSRVLTIGKAEDSKHVLLCLERNNFVRMRNLKYWKTKLVTVVKLVVYKRFGSGLFLFIYTYFLIFFFFFKLLTLPMLHPFFQSADCTGAYSFLTGQGREGQDGTHGWTRDRQQHENHLLAFIPSTHTLT